MKQKQEKNHKQSGFTVIELLVVLSIMVVIATVVIIDFNRQRAVRNIVITKNETITNLRKIQSYMLSAKNIAEGVPAKFYIAEFEMSESGKLPTSFTVQAVDDQLNFHDNLETISLPAGVTFTSFKIEPSGKGKPTSYPCVQIIFSAPFGNMYANGSLSCDNSIVDILSDPLALSQLGQRRALLFVGVNGEDKGYIQVNPVTGQMTAY